MPLLQEEDLENICGGCREPLQDSPSSEWCGTIHYSSKVCTNSKCKYTDNSRRVVDGSGI